MPQLPNPRHERFAALVADGITSAPAYQEVGYRCNDGNAYALRHRNDVSDRINELLADKAAQSAEARARAVDEAQISASRIAGQLAEAYRVAKEGKRAEAMVSASVAQAKFAGLWVERSELTQKTAQPDLSRLSEAQLEALLQYYDGMGPLLQLAYPSSGEDH